MTTKVERPSLPERLSRLEELAIDLWWSWHPEGRAVFRHLDYALWRATAHNPVRMLRLIAPANLDAAADDPAFLALRFSSSLRSPGPKELSSADSDVQETGVGMRGSMG